MVMNLDVSLLTEGIRTLRGPRRGRQLLVVGSGFDEAEAADPLHVHRDFHFDIGSCHDARTSPPTSYILHFTEFPSPPFSFSPHVRHITRYGSFPFAHFNIITAELVFDISTKTPPPALDNLLFHSHHPRLIIHSIFLSMFLAILPTHLANAMAPTLSSQHFSPG